MKCDNVDKGSKSRHLKKSASPANTLSEVPAGDRIESCIVRISETVKGSNLCIIKIGI